jgi:hypothetical protein
MPLKSTKHKEVLEFITKHISFTDLTYLKFWLEITGYFFCFERETWIFRIIKIKFLNPNIYYTQANGQAESSNKLLIELVKNKLRIILGDDNKFVWNFMGSSYILIDIMLL